MAVQNFTQLNITKIAFKITYASPRFGFAFCNLMTNVTVAKIMHQYILSINSKLQIGTRINHLEKYLL